MLMGMPKLKICCLVGISSRDVKQPSFSLIDSAIVGLCSRLKGANSEHHLSQKLARIQEVPAASSCIWSHDHPSIRPWLENSVGSSQGPRLMIWGGAGTGKSILAAHLVDQVLPQQKPGEPGLIYPVHRRLSCAGQHSSSEELVLYWFCGLDYDGDNNKPESGIGPQDYQAHRILKWPAHVIMRTFLRQIISAWDPHYEQLRRPLIDNLVHSERRGVPLEQLMEYFFPLLESYPKSW
jgi:hypothetical protein